MVEADGHGSRRAAPFLVDTDNVNAHNTSRGVAFALPWTGRHCAGPSSPGSGSISAPGTFVQSSSTRAAARSRGVARAMPRSEREASPAIRTHRFTSAFSRTQPASSRLPCLQLCGDGIVALAGLSLLGCGSSDPGRRKVGPPVSGKREGQMGRPWDIRRWDDQRSRRGKKQRRGRS